MYKAYLQITGRLKRTGAKRARVRSSIAVPFHVHAQIIARTGNFVAVRTSEQLPLVALPVDAKDLLVLQPESEHQAQQCYMHQCCTKHVSKSKSKSHYDGQSVSQSWCRA
jgi:hypothetical protein